MAFREDKSFIITWEGHGEGWGNYFQMFDVNGNAIGKNKKIVEDLVCAQTRSRPNIATRQDGSFIITWKIQCESQKIHVLAQRFDMEGDTIGSNIEIDSTATGEFFVHDPPAIVIDSADSVLIVWEEKRGGRNDSDIFGQRFHFDTVEFPTGSFKVNDDAGTKNQDSPVMALDDDGCALIVWEDDRNSTGDIFGQFYDPTGSAVGGNIKIDSDINFRSEPHPTVAAEGRCNFVVAWEWSDTLSTFPEIIGEFGINAQRFQGLGNFKGQNYRVNNNFEQTSKTWPSVKLVDGRIYYTWGDGRNEGQGGDIFARIDLFNHKSLPPALQTPENGIFSSSSEQTFSFSAPVDLDDDSLHFKVEIAKDSDFSSQIAGSPFESWVDSTGFNRMLPVAAGGGDVSFTPPDSLPDGRYFWRVTAWDGFELGEISDIHSFTIDTRPPFTAMHQPADGDSGVAVDANITFHLMDSLSGVMPESIEMKVNSIAIDPSALTVTGEDTDFSVTYDPPENFGYGKTIFVSIEAQDNAGNRMEIDDYQFVTFRRDPEKPKLVSPPNFYKGNDFTPTLSWFAPSDPDMDSLHFQVEIAKDNAFQFQIDGSPFRSDSMSTTGFRPKPPILEGGGEVSFTTDSLADGQYFWRVFAWDGFELSEMSETWSFIVDIDRPQAPKNLQATGGNPSPWQQGDNSFVITWDNPSDLSGVARYLYRFDERPNEEIDFVGSDSAKLEFTPRLKVEAKKQFGQRLFVWLEDSAGNSGYLNPAVVNLRYFDPEELIGLKLFSPAEGDTLGKPVHVQSNVFDHEIKEARLDYDINGQYGDDITPDTLLWKGQKLFSWVWPAKDASGDYFRAAQPGFRARFSGHSRLCAGG